MDRIDCRLSSYQEEAHLENGLLSPHPHGEGFSLGPQPLVLEGHQDRGTASVPALTVPERDRKHVGLSRGPAAPPRRWVPGFGGRSDGGTVTESGVRLLAA